MLQMRDSVHLNFNRNGNLLLDFLGCAARPLGDDLHPNVGNVRVSFDRQRLECHHAPEKEQHCHAQDDEPIIEGLINQKADHCCSAVFWNSTELPPPSCPTLTPYTIPRHPPGSIPPPVT